MTEPFNIVVVGDFSGRGGQIDSATRGDDRSEAPLPVREAILHSVDRDDFDLVMSRIVPRVDLPGLSTPLEFRSWGEFHPESWLERVPELSNLMKARASLSDPKMRRPHLQSAGLDPDFGPGNALPAPPSPSVSGVPAEWNPRVAVTTCSRRCSRIAKQAKSQIKALNGG